MLNEARQTPDEDFLAVWEWAPKLLSKVKLTPPLCPACEAPMDELILSSGATYANSKPQTTSHGEELEQPVVLDTTRSISNRQSSPSTSWLTKQWLGFL